MGGHGGLNILPQKRWNVYGRENRLKVARDEEQYEIEQKELREKHEQAEREFRHRMLLERARQRYGDPTAIEGDNQPPPLLPPSTVVAVSSTPAADVQIDYEALEGLSHQIASKEQHDVEETGRHQPGGSDRQKGKRDRKKERMLEARTSGGITGRAPRLAELAQQLQLCAEDSAAAAIRGGSGSGAADAIIDKAAASAAAATQQIATRFTSELLTHVNFFAEEEQKAKNPEVEAEKRAERRARGDPKTQTSDSKFDERFKLGYGLTGKEATPWYAQHAATLPGSAIELLEAPSHHTAQLDQWRHAGQLALTTGSHSESLRLQAEGQGQQQALAARAPEKSAVAAADSAEAARSLLLGSTRATEGRAAAATDEEGKTKERKKRKRRRASSNGESSSRSSGSDSGSDSDNSSDRREKKHRHKTRQRRKNKDERKRSSSKKGKGGSSLLEKLRIERLEREAAEKQRQHLLLLNHVAAARQGEAEGRKYHGGFGFGRPPLGR